MNEWDIQQFLQNMMQQMIGQYDPSMIGDWLGKNVPKPPGTGDIQNILGGYAEDITGLFSQENKQDLLGNMLQMGNRMIDTQTGSMNRAAGSLASASGMYESAPLQSTISQNFAKAGDLQTGLLGQVNQTGMQYDMNIMNALLGASGLQTQIAGMRGNDWTNLMNWFGSQSQAFPSLMSSLIGYGAYRGG